MQVANWLGAAILIACVMFAECQDAPKPKPEAAPAGASAQAPAPPCSVADGFTIAAVGDLIYSEPLSGLKDDSFQILVKLLHSPDVSFGNLENTLIDLSTFKGHPEAEYGGMHLIGAPSLAKDMRAMGLNMMSRANNHAADWGVEGMRLTDQAADEAGLVHAGTGYNKSAARAAHYLLTSKGRIGLVSMASTPTPLSVAADPVGRVPGRPGVSALRVTPYLVVSPEMMQWLDRIHDAQPPATLEDEKGRRWLLSDSSQQKPDEKSTDITVMEANFRTGDKTGNLTYEMNKSDLSEILKAIRQGKQNSDFMIATIHAHEFGSGYDEPADFLPKLAHAAIDAGADTFIGHGPHQLRGIEIYNGKPIFYSLGNFFFQLGLQEPASADYWEYMHADHNALTEHDAATRIAKAWFNDPVWYRSVIAVSRFEHGKIAEVRLYPVELNYAASNVMQGIPRQAPPEIAKEILERLQRLSKPYGTTITIENNVGLIRLQQ